MSNLDPLWQIFLDPPIFSKIFVDNKDGLYISSGGWFHFRNPAELTELVYKAL